MKRDLANPELFGNEAGEDEELEVLNSYFVEKEDFERFFSPSNRVAFVRSRKGVGKSALLKQTLFRRRMANAGELLIYLKSSALVAMQEVRSDSPDDLVFGWQQRICSRINYELGSILRHGFSDDSMLLIESAELAGFRGRNLVSALFDRLKLKGAPIDLSRERLTVTDSQALLSRVLDKTKDVTVWLFVDDVDATFINTKHERLRSSTFFSACRNLVNDVKGLCIRASVRTDVWSILAQYDESLDKCEQYMLDLTWSTVETGQILESKILSYLTRFYGDSGETKGLRLRRDRAKIFRFVFKEPFPWGRRRRLEAFRPIHILSAGRPRWAAQLCKLAGRDAFKKNASLIALGHVWAVMRDYGQARVSDLYKEHRHQCDAIEDIIETFSGGPTRYKTADLLEHLTKRYLKHRGMPKIDGISAEKGSITVANFLYRIGFIAARDEADRTGLGFVRFEDRPNLLSTPTNLDDGLDWEIHPSYREVLRIVRKKDQPADADQFPL